MKVEGTRTFAAPREAVWEVLNDPARMAKTMPGVESFDVQDERHWKANVKIPLGLGGLKMSINFEKTEERPPDFARLRAKGTGVGALMDMTTQFHLSEQDAGTSMRWEADVRIAGPVGSMGQRVLQPIVTQQVQNVLTALDRQVTEAAPAGGAREEPFVEGSEETPPGAAPRPAETAARWGEASASEMGATGTREPTTDMRPPHTPPDLRDEGPPADSGPETEPSEIEGTSGADEGISPWAPEPYEPEPEGPTQSTEEPREERP